LSDLLIGECPNCRKEMSKNIFNKDYIAYYCEDCNIFQTYISANKYHHLQGTNCNTYIPLCLSVTSAQQKQIGIINNVLHTNFRPFTKQEAKEIINEYYLQVKQTFQKQPATEKQLAYISIIATDLNIFCFYKTFNKQQAIEWLEKYIPIHKKYNKETLHPYTFEDTEYENVFNEILKRFNIHNFNDLRTFFKNDKLLKEFLKTIQPYANYNLLTIAGYTSVIMILEKIKKMNEEKNKKKKQK